MTASPTILVVDDEPILVKVTELYLKAAGFENVIGTTESPRAMQLVHTHAPDLVILDYSMPNVTGLDVLKAIRCDHTYGQTPVLIVTASSSEETTHQCLSHGACALLTKPVEADDLVSHVKAALVDSVVATT